VVCAAIPILSSTSQKREKKKKKKKKKKKTFKSCCTQLIATDPSTLCFYLSHPLVHFLHAAFPADVTVVAAIPPWATAASAACVHRALAIAGVPAAQRVIRASTDALLAAHAVKHGGGAAIAARAAAAAAASAEGGDADVCVPNYIFKKKIAGAKKKKKKKKPPTKI
jgi:hypothetical protein